MTMSKQDFEMIAAVLYRHRENLPADSLEVGAHDALIREFADELAHTNGMFQRDKFVRAATTGAHIRRSILPRP